ncbi:MAG: hypothetical protein ABSC22_07490 [Roseiarcus sp.]|jgi:hypothetical protein
MNASALPKSLRFALVLGAAGLCGACSSVESIMPTMAPSTWNGATTTRNATRNAGPTAESDKVVTLPMSAEDLDCPSVDVQDGAASYRVGGADNASVRYQFDIAQTARECDPQGSNFSLKVGVSGHLLIGPAGSPGAFNAPLRITVTRDADQKPAYSKVYKLEVNTAGAAQAPFEFVSDPIVLPMTRTELADDYTITVAFGNDQAAKVAPPKKRHPAKPSDAH